jgi:3-oxoacyl-[acyl-carrier protein] reductase
MPGKVTLITGGRRGLGKALALAFAEAGADVAICDYTDEGGELEAVADEIRKHGHRALPIKADVARKADVDNMVKQTVTELGDIDILINNAGVLGRGLVLETEEDTWDKFIDTNLKGPYLCSQAVGRLMVERRKGNIINIASTAGLKIWPLETIYGVSKAGLIMLTRGLARELGS